MTPVRVVLLDPTKAMEQAATAIFAGDHTVHVESRSGGAQVLNALVGANAAQIVVLPPALATQTALADLHEFAHRNPMVDLVMVSSQKDPDLMVQALRCGIREFVFEPFQNSELRAVIKRLAVNQLSGRRGAGHHAEVVAFIPCKGGAGASFLATNLAHVLVAKHHKKVLLIDLNLQFGDAFLFLMDKLPETTISEVAAGFSRLDASFLESSAAKLKSGLRLLAAPKSPEDGDLVKPEHVSGIIDVARGSYDYVILDVGRSLNAVAVRALDVSDRIYPVVQLILPFLRNAKRMKDLFRQLGYPNDKVRWIINRFDGEEQLSQKNASEMLDEAFWTVPNDHKHVTAAVNQGVPVTELAPWSPVSKSLLGWGTELTRVEPPKKSLLGRLFGR